MTYRLTVRVSIGLPLQESTTSGWPMGIVTSPPTVAVPNQSCGTLRPPKDLWSMRLTFLPPQAEREPHPP